MLKLAKWSALLLVVSYSSVFAQSLTSIGALRTYSTTPPAASLYIQGYYASGDSGGGTFNYVSTDTSSSDNHCTIIVDAAGHRWYRDTQAKAISAKWCGAYGDGSHDDTSAIQSWITLLTTQTSTDPTRMAGGYWPQGTYKLSSTIDVFPGESNWLPNLFTAGALAVHIVSTASPVFYFQGGSGAFSQAQWQGVTIDGSSNTGSNEGVRVDGTGFFTWNNLDLKNLYNGVRLYNLSSGNFSEGDLFPALNSESTVTVVMRLSVSAGTPSFRSSGIPGARINLPQSGNVLLIDSGAHPYMFDIDKVTVWPAGTSGTQTVFQINSTQNGNSVFGDITLEGGGGSQVVQLFSAASAYPITWKGSLIVQGVSSTAVNNVQIGQRVLRGGDSVTYDNGAVSASGVASQFRHVVVSTGETVPLSGNTLLNDGYMMTVRVDGTNYTYMYLFYAQNDGYGANQEYAQLANTRANNTAGWGAPTFSSNANNLIISNPNWTTGTTITWSVVPFSAIATIQ